MVNWCVVCKDNLDPINLLLLHCLISRNVWEFALSFLGHHWVKQSFVRC